MNADFFTEDLIASLKRDTVPQRYYPLIDFKTVLSAILNRAGAVRVSQISPEVLEEVRSALGDDAARLFGRFIHIFDFNKAKLRDIKGFEGTDSYSRLEELLYLPGVRLLRAELYLNSGVTLETLSQRTTEEIRDMVRAYIERDGRSEIVPLPKEVNCHREAAKMLLNADGRQGSF